MQFTNSIYEDGWYLFWRLRWLYLALFIGLLIFDGSILGIAFWGGIDFPLFSALLPFVGGLVLLVWGDHTWAMSRFAVFCCLIH